MVYCQHGVSFRCPLSGQAIGLARGLSGVSISLKELALGLTDSTVTCFCFMDTLKSALFIVGCLLLRWNSVFIVNVERRD